jgi:hypothetical protein
MEKKEKKDPLKQTIDSNDKERLEWYFSWVFIFVSFCIAGPLGLFLVWFRPGTPVLLKIIISVFVLALTLWMTFGAVDYYRKMADYYEQLAGQMESM